MEAVVKSLDPNLTAHRDAVLDTATEVLGHVVKTYVFIRGRITLLQYPSESQISHRGLPRDEPTPCSGYD